jgi:hypothetical protein
MGLTNIYNSLNNTSYNNAYYVFVDYDEKIREFDESPNLILPSIFWKSGHHINPIFLVYENKESKLNNEQPIGLLTSHPTGKTAKYSDTEKIVDLQVVFMFNNSINLTIEEQSFNHLKSLEYYSNGIIE